MLAFLAQGGGRRIIGVTVGAAIIVWIQAQQTINIRRLALAGAAAIALLAGMQFMLNIRTIGYERVRVHAAPAITTICTSTTISCAWRR